MGVKDAAGHYLGDLVPGQHGLATLSTGTPYVHVTFRVHSFKHADGTYKPFAPYERTVQLWVTDKALQQGAVKTKLAKLGFNGEFAPGAMVFNPATDVELENRHESKPGDSELWDRWDMSGSGSMTHGAPTAGLAEQLKAKMGDFNLVQTDKAPAGAAPPPPAPTTPVAGPFDETPLASTRTEAWKSLCDRWSDADRPNADGLVEEWKNLLEREFPGKAEGAYTPSDWASITSHAYIPF